MSITTSARSRSGAEQLALGADPVDDPPVRAPAGGGGGSPCSGRAASPRRPRGRAPSGSSPPPSRSSSTCEQVVEVLAAAHVGDDRGALDAAALVAEELAEAADHPRRQVVDAEVAAVLEGGDRLRLAGPRVAGDHDQVDPLLGGPRRLRRPSASRLISPLLCSWRWISRATLPGMPGTASSSSRLAREQPLRRAEVLQQGPLADRPDARQLVEHRARSSPGRGGCGGGRSRSGAPRRGPAAAAAGLRVAARARAGSSGPGTKTSSSRLARPITVDAALDERLERPHPGRELALAAVDHDQVGQRGEALVALASCGERSACSR